PQREIAVRPSRARGRSPPRRLRGSTTPSATGTVTGAERGRSTGDDVPRDEPRACSLVVTLRHPTPQVMCDGQWHPGTSVVSHAEYGFGALAPGRATSAIRCVCVRERPQPSP